MLLITHDPRVPRIGLGRQAALKRMDVSAISSIGNPSVWVVTYGLVLFTTKFF